MKAPSYSRWSKHAARLAGRTRTFNLAMLLILGWLLTGPFFDFSDTWQLVVNTTTTIITFLMVFLLLTLPINIKLQTKSVFLSYF